MSLIDTTYFIGDITLPNLDEISTRIQTAIDRYEEEILKSLLGYELHEEFIAALAGTPAQKWIDLRDGVEFTFEFCGDTVIQKWNGLINSELISLISYYVYYKHRYNELSDTTSINDVIGIPENAEKVNDVRKMVYAWNKGLKLYGDINDYDVLYSKYRSYYLGFNKYSDTYEFFNDAPSAYNFLNANRADYSNWIFSPLNRMNEFGI